MTRDELIKAIYDSEERWSCPSNNCDKSEEELNCGEGCLKCAEQQLAEYEKAIRAEGQNAIEKIELLRAYMEGRVESPLFKNTRFYEGYKMALEDLSYMLDL